MSTGYGPLSVQLPDYGRPFNTASRLDPIYLELLGRTAHEDLPALIMIIEPLEKRSKLLRTGETPPLTRLMQIMLETGKGVADASTVLADEERKVWDEEIKRESKRHMEMVWLREQQRALTAGSASQEQIDSWSR